MSGEGLKLDLGCGQAKRDGYTGVDYKAVDGVDVELDLWTFPWPWSDGEVEAIHSSHLVEHIPHDLAAGGPDGFFQFMDECWRILQPDGVMEHIHPYAGSKRAFQDPTHRRFIPEATWYYLDRQWRNANRLDHYEVHCDFEVVTITGLGVPNEIQLRNHEAQAFARTHYWETIQDLHVILRARK